MTSFEPAPVLGLMGVLLAAGAAVAGLWPVLRELRRGGLPS